MTLFVSARHLRFDSKLYIRTTGIFRIVASVVSLSDLQLVRTNKESEGAISVHIRIIFFFSFFFFFLFFFFFFSSRLFVTVPPHSLKSSSQWLHICTQCCTCSQPLPRQCVSARNRCHSNWKGEAHIELLTLSLSTRVNKRRVSSDWVFSYFPREGNSITHSFHFMLTLRLR